MKKLLTYIIITAAALNAGCCKEIPDAPRTDASIVIVDNLHNIRLHQGTDSFALRFNSNYDWRIEVESDCFTVHPTSGAAGFATAVIDITNDIEAAEGADLGKFTIIIDQSAERQEVNVVRPSQLPDGKKTIIAYFFGTSLQYDLNNNAKEMQKAVASGAIGSNSLIAIRQSSSTKAEIREMYLDEKNGACQTILLETIDLPDALDSETFGAYMKKMMDYAPADNYSAIFLGHSTAWLPDNPIRTVALSNGFHPSFEQRPGAPVMTRTIGEKNVMLGIGELADGLESTGAKFDCLYFDVCFMSSFEAAYELRNTADIVIASPCEIMGYGSPYNRILKPLFDSDYQTVCKEFWDFYENTYFYSSGCISTIDCQKLEQTAEVVKRINATAAAEDFDLSTVQYYEGRTDDAISPSYRGHIFYDADDYLSKICSDSELISEFRDRLAECVPYSYHTKKFYSAYNDDYNDIYHYSGISLTPDEKCIETMTDEESAHRKILVYYNPYLQETGWYKATH